MGANTLVVLLRSKHVSTCMVCVYAQAISTEERGCAVQQSLSYLTVIITN